MSRDRLVQMTRRTIEHAVAGTMPLVDSHLELPVTNYYDRGRWQLEMDRIFRRVPLVLAFSSEFTARGSYKAIEVMGVPIIITRSDDGVLRSFVNMCSHRGAIIMEEGKGTTRRFVCPYHAWSYDTRGNLAGVFDGDNYGEFDWSCHGLTPLPVEEHAGIVFGGITPGMDWDLQRHLCGYGEMLPYLGLADCSYVGSQSVAGPNWKVAYDGYLDYYHLPILHKNTFGPDYNNRTVNESFGPHQRNIPPDSRFLPLADIPEDEWTDLQMVGGVWTIFPHVSIASFDAGGRLYMVSQLFPGDGPDTSVTTQHFLAVGEVDDERQALIDKRTDFLLQVVRDEDYYTGNRIQRAVKTGAKTHFRFGRNEGPCQAFHQFVQRLVDAETPADTAAVFNTSAG